VGELDGYDYCPYLLRKKPHRPLHTLPDADSRDSEVKGKYSSAYFSDVTANRVRLVVVIDDIVTRGATMDEVARAIKKENGDIPVYGVALAKNERKSFWNDQISNDHISEQVLSMAGLA